MMGLTPYTNSTKCFHLIFSHLTFLLTPLILNRRRNWEIQLSTAMAGEPVGDFYVHLLVGQVVSKELTSSQKLLRLSNGNRPSVIHFYDGG